MSRFQLVAMEVDEVRGILTLRYEGEKRGSNAWYIESFHIPRDEKIETALKNLAVETASSEAVVNGVPQRRANTIYFMF